MYEIRSWGYERSIRHRTTTHRGVGRRRPRRTRGGPSAGCDVAARPRARGRPEDGYSGQKLLAGGAFDDPVAHPVQVLPCRQALRQDRQALRRERAELQHRLTVEPHAFCGVTPFDALRTLLRTHSRFPPHPVGLKQCRHFASTLLPPLKRLDRGKHRILARILPPLRGAIGRGCAMPPRARVRRGPGRGLPPRPRPGRPDRPGPSPSHPRTRRRRPPARATPPAPCTTTVPTPRASPATTGTPRAWASSIAMPIGSPSAGHTKRSQALTIPCSAAPPPRPETGHPPGRYEPREHRLHLGAGGAVACHEQMPRHVQDPFEGTGQQPERFRLAPAAHHRDTGEERRRGIGAHRTRDTCATA